MKKDSVMVCSVVLWAILAIIASTAQSEVASCQAEEQGLMASCMEFASIKPIPASMEKACIFGGSRSNRWVNSSCPRLGAIGYCEVFSKDTITRVVYCYKRQGIADKQKLEFCKQACKGRFSPY